MMGIPNPSDFGFISIFLVLSLVATTFALEFSLGGSPPGPNISKSYDPHFRPNHGAVADMLNLSIDSLTIQDVDEQKMKLNLELMLRTSWTDPRLAYSVKKTTSFTNNFPTIWMPDLYMIDSAQVTSIDHKVGKSLTVKPGGEVVLNERHVVEVHCNFFFAKVPFDAQVCKIGLKSFGFSVIHLDMVWNGRIDETQVKLFHSEFGLASIEQSSDKEQRVDGEFRVLSAVVRLRRNPLKHLKIIMIPGVIFTIVGYLSLFILEDSTLTDIPNLVSFELGLTRLILSAAVFLMFQLNTQIYYIRESVGGVMTGADIWILVVSAIQILLLAYNVTLVIASKRTVLSHSVDEEKSKPCLQRIGKYFIFGIPLCSVIFLIIYFIVYLI